MSQTVISPRPACHQRRTRSGSVYARQTSSLGASNSRVIRIWSSAGSVTDAVALLAIVFLLLELLDHGFELIEAIRPRPFEVLDPIVDGPQGLAVEPVDAPPAFAADGHRPHLAQDAQV